MQARKQFRRDRINGSEGGKARVWKTWYLLFRQQESSEKSRWGINRELRKGEHGQDVLWCVFSVICPCLFPHTFSDLLCVMSYRTIGLGFQRKIGKFWSLRSRHCSAPVFPFYQLERRDGLLFFTPREPTACLTHRRPSVSICERMNENVSSLLSNQSRKDKHQDSNSSPGSGIHCLQAKYGG